jgi:hypothetical protein
MKKQKTSHFIVLIIIEIIEAIFMNTVPLWLQYTKGVILPTWIYILWAVNLSLIVRTAGNLVLAVRRPARLYLIIQSINMTIGLMSMIVFLTVFPINFSAIGAAGLNTLIVVFTVIGLALGTLGVIVNLVKAIRGVEYDDAGGKGTPA